MKQYSKRRGFTLIEMIVVIFVATIIMSISGMLFSLTFDMFIRHKQHTLDRSSRIRLLQAFRQDVHSFGLPRTEFPDPPESKEKTLLKWETKEGTLSYSVLSSDNNRWEVKRTLSRKEGIPHCESFLLPNTTRIDVYRDSEKHPRLVALSLWRSPKEISTVEKKDLNPFTGEIAEPLAKRIHPQFAANWNFSLVRVPSKTP